MFVDQVPRLMTMNPLYPYGKPSSTGTHDKTLKKLALFAAIINGYDGITASNLNSVEVH